MNRVYTSSRRTLFGEVSAPSLANYTMRRNAEENGGDLPPGVKAVYKYFYMDDGLPSSDSREEAIEMRKQMTELLLRGGFYLQKWLINDPEVLATIPVDSEDRSPRFLELSEEYSYQQTMHWALRGMLKKMYLCSMHLNEKQLLQRDQS